MSYQNNMQARPQNQEEMRFKQQMMMQQKERQQMKLRQQMKEQQMKEQQMKEQQMMMQRSKQQMQTQTSSQPSEKYFGANNVYYKEGCPALMSDGRFLTYWNSSNELTEEMRRLNKFKSENEFRIFLQSNADLFMQTERDYLMKNNTCAPQTACSEGFFDLWSRENGYWACNMGNGR